MTHACREGAEAKQDGCNFQGVPPRTKSSFLRAMRRAWVLGESLTQ